MADSYTVEKLSGSTNGKGIKLAHITSTSAETIHTAPAGVDIDLVTLWAVNQDTVDHTVTLGWGAVVDPDNRITVTVPAQAGPVAICDRMPLSGALAITAWASTANVVMLYGTVERVGK